MRMKYVEAVVVKTSLLANSNYEGSFACNLGLEKKYAIGEGTHVRLHDMSSF